MEITKDDYLNEINRILKKATLPELEIVNSYLHHLIK